MAATALLVETNTYQPRLISCSTCSSDLQLFNKTPDKTLVVRPLNEGCFQINKMSIGCQVRSIIS